MRGEHLPTNQLKEIKEGSSPHAREHPRHRVTRHRIMGSSPHARGTLGIFEYFELLIGIIPACAGNTLCCSCRLPPRRDHPRMRGEHGRGKAKERARSGSSPHARGTLVLYILCQPKMGIIPACAGNTVRRGERVVEDWDHPRMRGEHGDTLTSLIPPSGSSPHARGTLASASRQRVRHGIIPACAGNTRLGHQTGRPSGDHPRMAFRGSSPHARGTLGSAQIDELLAGIIPACAGNT